MDEKKHFLLYDVLQTVTKSVVPIYHPSQAVCRAVTPLGSAFPRGMFGAVEDGQEEAVRFFQAWKAEVLPLKKGFESWIISYFPKTSISLSMIPWYQ